MHGIRLVGLLGVIGAMSAVAAAGRVEMTACGQAEQSAEALFAEVQKRYAHEGLPTALRPPMTPEQADAFVAAVRFFREAAPKDLEAVKAADVGDSRQLKSDKQRLENWLGNEVPRRLDMAVRQTRQNLAGAVDGRLSYIKFGADIDMSNENQVLNNLANPEQIEQREAAIREALASAELLARIDEQMGEKSEWAAKKKEIEELAAKFREKVAAAARLIVPPKDIGDAGLREIAEKTLKDPKYGAKEWKRLIVNSPKQSKQFSIYEVRDRTLMRVDYDFDHFQATTIEPEGDDLYLFHNMLAFYRSGAPTTPLNKWVLRERFRGARILAENVDK